MNMHSGEEFEKEDARFGPVTKVNVIIIVMFAVIMVLLYFFFAPAPVPKRNIPVTLPENYQSEVTKGTPGA